MSLITNTVFTPRSTSYPLVAPLMSLPLLFALGCDEDVPGDVDTDEPIEDVCDALPDLDGDYAFLISDLPDFDQKRLDNDTVSGLPNRGNMYCGPTSATNILAHIANNGHPDVGPGPGTWDPSAFDSAQEAVAAYESITEHLYELGETMETHPIDGTKIPNLTQGLADSLPADAFVVRELEHGDCDADAPPLDMDTVGEVLALGGYAIILKTSFRMNPATGVYRKTGGHYMALAGIRKQDGAYMLAAHDSLAPDSLFLQSEFKRTPYALQQRSFTFETPVGNCTRQMWELQGEGGQAQMLNHVALVVPAESAECIDSN